MALIPSNVRAVFFTGAITLTLTMVASEEGERNEAYLDIVGIPTICYGDTEGVEMGQTADHGQCVQRLRKRVNKLVPSVTKMLGPNANEQVVSSIASFCDNVGAAGCSGSDAVRRIRAGDVRGGCDALLNWTRAKNQRMALYKRRMRERAICLAGDDIAHGREVNLDAYQQPPEWFVKRVTQWGLRAKL